jgi:hypothetical protein
MVNLYFSGTTSISNTSVFQLPLQDPSGAQSAPTRRWRLPRRVAGELFWAGFMMRPASCWASEEVSSIAAMKLSDMDLCTSSRSSRRRPEAPVVLAEVLLALL